MQNIIYLLYDKLKPKQQNLIKLDTYTNDIIDLVASIIAIDGIEDKLDLDYEMLQQVRITEGIVGIVKKNDTYYAAFNIMTIGLPDRRLRAKKVNATIQLDDDTIETREYTVGEDIVLWYNTAYGVPEFDVERYASMFSEVDKSIEIAVDMTRNSKVLAVANDIEKTELEKILDNIKKGIRVVFKVDRQKTVFSKEENPVIDLTDPSSVDKIQYLSHLYDDYLKRLGNKFGCCMNMSSKQAEQTEKEISGMEQYSWITPINMLRQAQLFCDRMKEVFNVELTAHYGIVHELRWHQYSNDCTEKDDDNNINTEDDGIMDDNNPSDQDGEEGEDNES